jgi:hypothetical protein
MEHGSMSILPRVKVSKEVAEALAKLPNDEASKQQRLISHSSCFSGNGILMRNNKLEEFEVLNSLQPLEYAKILILGYYVEDVEDEDEN